jgi:hypothetical protein
MQPSSRITSTPAAGSGAGAGQLSHWPHLGGGASSSWGTSAGGISDTVVVAAVAATTVATSCCNPVTSAVGRCGSLAAVALSILDERRLVGTDVPDLSTLAGARSGTIGATVRAQR